MKRLWLREFKSTTLQLFLFLGILFGVGWVRLSPSLHAVPALLWLPFAVLTWRRRNALTALVMILFGWCCGYGRGLIYAHKLADYEPYYYQKLSLTAVASEDATYGKTKQLTFMANHVELVDGTRLTGKVQLSGFGVNAVFQGDEVTATGSLYPTQGAYQGRMSFAKLTVTARHPALISGLRRRFVAGMQTALPEPLASFAMGLLVGQRATLPGGVKQDLLMVGLTHIIAVSGYNLTIILQASRRVFGRRSKRVATGLSLGLIGVFLLVAGASASIVRAAIVSVLSIWAAYYGRSIKPINLLALAAVITVWANPFYLWGDLSWYLSFLAFYGVMIVSPLVQNRLPGKWHQSLIGSVALESICAEMMSLPFVLHIFGQMSLIGLPANVLVVAFVPLAMLLGLIAGLAGMLMGPVSGWLAWPAEQLLNYMLDIAHLMAHIPGVFIQNRSLSLTAMLGLYGLITVLTTALWHKTKSVRSAIITDRNVRT